MLLLCAGEKSEEDEGEKSQDDESGGQGSQRHHKGFRDGRAFKAANKFVSAVLDFSNASVFTIKIRPLTCRKLGNKKGRAFRCLQLQGAVINIPPRNFLNY